MNPFKIILSNYKRTFTRNERSFAKSIKNKSKSFENPLNAFEDSSIFNVDTSRTDNYLCNAWVSIAINILIRNLARADFVLECGGEELKIGPLHDLFHRPNKNLSRYDLWKETAAWWHLEGEAFW
jgi:hypothetical protein